MDGSNGIEIAGQIVEVAGPESPVRVRLPNGHCLTGFVARDDREKFKNRLVQGAQVALICSSFDFSKGRIIKIE